MNCFKWQNRVSDYLDESLSQSLKKEADEHLNQCRLCSAKEKHYRQILAQVSELPKHNLPSTLREKPLSSKLLQKQSFFSLSYGHKIPWSLRMLLESGGIIGSVLLVISLAPMIRSLYKNHLEKMWKLKTNLLTASSYLEEEFESEFASSLKNQEDFVNSPLSPENFLEHQSSQVGQPYLWRFILKKVNPHQLRPRIIQALKEIGVPQFTPALHGIPIPAGIEFKFELPHSLVIPIKTAIEKIAFQENQLGKENFTWYKAPSKKPLPKGKSQVVIWLFQSP